MSSPAAAVDLGAERAASRARWDSRHLDTSARVLLHISGPGARREIIEDWCTYQHPNWTTEQRAELIDRAVELQAAAAPRPVAATDIHSEPATTEMINIGGETYMGSDSVDMDPAPPRVTPAETSKPSAAEVKKVIREILDKEPGVRFADCQRQVEKHFSVRYNPGTFHGYWRPVRAELGLDKPAGGTDTQASRPRERKASAAALPAPAPVESRPTPAEDAPAETSAPEDRTPGLEPARGEPVIGYEPAEVADEQLEQVAEEPAEVPVVGETADLPADPVSSAPSEREPYGGDREGIHLEAYEDEWRVRVELLFDSREDAIRTFARMLSALA